MQFVVFDAAARTCHECGVCLVNHQERRVTGNRADWLARKAPAARIAPRRGPAPLPWGLALLVIAALSAAAWLGVIWLAREALGLMSS